MFFLPETQNKDFEKTCEFIANFSLFTNSITYSNCLLIYKITAYSWKN